MARRADDKAEIQQVQTEDTGGNAEIQQPEPNPQNGDRILVRTVHAAGFWRGGLLFTQEWQEVNRAEVGKIAWERIINEPALQIQSEAD